MKNNSNPWPLWHKKLHLGQESKSALTTNKELQRKKIHENHKKPEYLFLHCLKRLGAPSFRGKTFRDPLLHLHLCARVFKCIHIGEYMQVNIWNYVYVYVYACVYVDIHAYVHTCAYVHVYVYVCVYMHMYLKSVY